MKPEIHSWKESSNRNAPACLYSPSSPNLMMLPLSVLSLRLPPSCLCWALKCLLWWCLAICLLFLSLCFLVLTLWLLLAIDSINSSFTRSHRTIQKLETPFKIRYSCKLIKEYSFFFFFIKRGGLLWGIFWPTNQQPPMPAVIVRLSEWKQPRNPNNWIECGAGSKTGMHGEADELCSMILTHTTLHLHASSWVIKPTCLLHILWFHSHDIWEWENWKQESGLVVATAAATRGVC